MYLYRTQPNKELQMRFSRRFKALHTMGDAQKERGMKNLITCLTVCVLSGASIADTVTLSLGGHQSWGQFGNGANYQTSLSIPAGSVFTSISVQGGYGQAWSPSWLSDMGIAIHIDLSSGSNWYGFHIFEGLDYSGSASASQTWNLTEDTYFCNDGEIEIQLYESYDDPSVSPDGNWFGGNLVVTYDPPPPPSGACCVSEFKSCLEIPMSNCDMGGGIYQGDGTSCEDVDCTQPPDEATFSITNQTRSLAYYAAVSNCNTPNNSSEDEYTHPDMTALDHTIGDSLSLWDSSTGSAQASQISSFSDFLIKGEGAASGSSSGSNAGCWGRGDGRATSTFFAAFTLSNHSDATFDWSIGASGNSQVHATSLVFKRGSVELLSESTTSSTLSDLTTMPLFAGDYTIEIVSEVESLSGSASPSFKQGSAQWSVELKLPEPCPEDVNQDGVVDVLDLLIIIADWGTCTESCAGDVNGDRQVNVSDLLILIENWGACNPPVGAVQWPISEGGNGHWYLVVLGNYTWQQASDYANSLGGHLATVTNSNEQDWLLIQSLNDGANLPYIGGFQDTSSPDYTEPGGGWTWVTGESWVFTNWSSDEPNNSGGSENWLHYGSSTGLWNDIPSNSNYDLIIEWSN